jgi:ABC-type sugar transport system ATPase subunit
MTVSENVAVPLLARKVDADSRRRRVTRALEAVGLESFADRSATKLSGGQQQRLALARCIVAESMVILLDEPLSNLDARLRVQMRSELRNLQRTFSTTMLLVTHDQEEAMSIADNVYLLDAGGLVQAGPPGDLYLRPINRFCAEFFGLVNIFPISQVSVTEGKLAIATPQGVDLHAKASTSPPATGDVVAVVRPEAWTVSLRSDEPVASWFPGEVRETLFLGGRTEAVLETPLGRLNVIMKGSDIIGRGTKVNVSREIEYMHFIEAEQAVMAIAP